MRIRKYNTEIPHNQLQTNNQPPKGSIFCSHVIAIPMEIASDFKHVRSESCYCRTVLYFLSLAVLYHMVQVCGVWRSLTFS